MLKSTNHYQLEKIKKFFPHLQTGSFLTTFSRTLFQSLVVVSYTSGKIGEVS